MEMSNETNVKLPFLEKLFCFLIVWGSGTQVELRFSYIYYAIVVTFALIVLSGEFRYRKAMSIPIGVIAILLFISLALNVAYSNSTGITATINTFLIILCSLLFGMNKPYLNVLRIKTIVQIFLIFSFLSTLLFILFNLGLIKVSLVARISNISTFYYLLNVTPSDLMFSVYRNGGIYWEPGMYQVFLNFVLIYYLYNNNLKHRNFIVVYLAVVIISTISVSGYVLALGIFALYGISNKGGKRFYKIMARVVIVVGLVVLVPIVSDLLFAKEDTGSYAKRNLDLVLAWDVFLNHPLIGHGIVNETFNKAYYALMGEERPSSNGLMGLLMGTGILGAFFYSISCVRVLKFFSKVYTKQLILPLLLWLVISINTEPIQYQSFISFLFGVGLAYFYNPAVIRIRNNRM